MPKSGLTFRIFVSSTFSDLKAERDVLHEQVFPRLRELCQQRGHRFQAIDLRWGVSEEAGLDQQTMKICLSEIARCQQVTPRPNFIILLGDRYGWRSLPAEIPVAEFGQILAVVADLEVSGLLQAWYRRDDNAVPPVYRLQPRRGEYVDTVAWESRVEHPLRTALAVALPRLALPEERRQAYLASATEQEVRYGVLRAPDAAEHVFCFSRTIAGLPGDTSSHDYLDVDSLGAADTESAGQLAALRAKLRSLLGTRVFEYRAQWSGSGPTLDHLPALCTDVYRELAQIIEAEIAQHATADPLAEEIAEHQEFGAQLARNFIGRVEALAEIEAYLAGSAPGPLVVSGPSGAGKSSLLARAAVAAQADDPTAVIISRFLGTTPASATVRDLLASLCRQISLAFDYQGELASQLAELASRSADREALEKQAAAIRDQYAIPDDEEALARTFARFLAFVPQGRRLILFLDALDQLSGETAAVQIPPAWLPSAPGVTAQKGEAAGLSPNVRLVVSTLAGDTSIAPSGAHLMTLAPMPADEGAALLDLWLAQAGRSLQPAQRQAVLTRFAACGLPLYLRLAFEHARTWASYDAPPALSGDVDGIVNDLLERMGDEANHGRTLVERSLGYLAASRYGLSEDELLDILSADPLVLADLRRRSPRSPVVMRLPVVVWSRLYRDLEPYLAERRSDGALLLGFYHRQLLQAVTTRFLAGAARPERHAALAAYFAAKPLWLVDGQGESQPRRRKLAELPYQQAQAGLWDEATATLCDLRLIQAAAAAGTVYRLVADFRSLEEALPEAAAARSLAEEHAAEEAGYLRDLAAFAAGARPTLPSIVAAEPWSEERQRAEQTRLRDAPSRHDRLSAFRRFVDGNAYLLARYGHLPSFCLQQAYNQAEHGPVTDAAAGWLQAAPPGPLLLRLPRQRPRYQPRRPLLRSVSGANCVVSADAGLAASMHKDGAVRLWDLRHGARLGELRGHDAEVLAVALAADGRHALSGDAAGRLIYWDLERRQELTVWHDPDAGPTGLRLALSADGGRALSYSFCAGEAPELRLWSTCTGAPLARLAGHRGMVQAASCSADGTRAVSLGRNDRTLRVWELAQGACLCTWRVNRAYHGLAITPDGRLALLWGYGRHVLALYDLATGTYRWRLASERGPVLDPDEASHRADDVTGADITPDGRLVVAVRADGEVVVHDLARGTQPRVFRADDGARAPVRIAANGRVAVSAGRSGVLHVWDVESGESATALDRPPLPRAEVVPDGSAIVSVTGNGLSVWPPAAEAHRFDLDANPRWPAATPMDVGIGPDGAHAVGVHADGTLRSWSLPERRPLARISGEGRRPFSPLFTPDGRHIVTPAANLNSPVHLWDVRTGAGRSAFECGEGASGVLSGDGAHLLLSSHREAIWWDLTSLTCLRTLLHPASGEPNSPDFSLGVGSGDISPDGRLALTASGSTVRLWDLETGACSLALVGHVRFVQCVRFSPDGRQALSGGYDGTVRLWDLRSGHGLLILTGSGQSMDRIAFTQDGRRAVAVDRAHWIWLFDLARGELLAVYPGAGDALAKERVGLGTLTVNTNGYITYRTAAAAQDAATRILRVPEGMLSGLPVATIERLWQHGAGDGRGHWADAPDVRCPWCGQRFAAPPARLVAAEAGLRPGPAGYPTALELPDAAWEEPDLEATCPHCRRGLRLNPFLLDGSRNRQAPTASSVAEARKARAAAFRRHLANDVMTSALILAILVVTLVWQPWAWLAALPFVVWAGRRGWRRLRGDADRGFGYDEMLLPTATVAAGVLIAVRLGCFLRVGGVLLLAFGLRGLQISVTSAWRLLRASRD